MHRFFHCFCVLLILSFIHHGSSSDWQPDDLPPEDDNEQSTDIATDLLPSTNTLPELDVDDASDLLFSTIIPELVPEELIENVTHAPTDTPAVAIIVEEPKKRFPTEVGIDRGFRELVSSLPKDKCRVRKAPAVTDMLFFEKLHCSNDDSKSTRSIEF